MTVLNDYQVTGCTYETDGYGRVTGSFLAPVVPANAAFSWQEWRVNYTLNGSSWGLPITGAQIGPRVTFSVGHVFGYNQSVTFNIEALVNQTGVGTVYAHSAESAPLVPNPPAVIESVDPISGTLYGGYALSISGRKLENVVSVLLGGVECLEKDTQTTAFYKITVPPGPLGAKDLVIRTRDFGTATLINAFVYVASAVSGEDYNAISKAIEDAKAAVNSIRELQVNPDTTAEELLMLSDLAPAAQEPLTRMLQAYEAYQALTYKPTLPHYPPPSLAATNSAKALSNSDPILAPMSVAEVDAHVSDMLAGNTYPAMP